MERIRAVLDTNIVVSAHIRTDGLQAIILGLGLANKFEMVVSEELLVEYESVLGRKRFGFAPPLVMRSIQDIRRVATLVIPKTAIAVTRDPDDNMVLECAVEAGAHYIVTGNMRHFPPKFRRTAVVAPRTFITILAAHIR